MSQFDTGRKVGEANRERVLQAPPPLEHAIEEDTNHLMAEGTGFEIGNEL